MNRLIKMILRRKGDGREDKNPIQKKNETAFLIRKGVVDITGLGAGPLVSTCAGNFTTGSISPTASNSLSCFSDTSLQVIPGDYSRNVEIGHTQKGHVVDQDQSLTRPSIHSSHQDESPKRALKSDDAASTSHIRCQEIRGTAKSMEITRLDTQEIQCPHLSQYADKDKPRYRVGCTSHECHGSMMEKHGINSVCNDDYISTNDKIKEAESFLKQYATESNIEDCVIKERIRTVVNDIKMHRTYTHTFEELEYGCRVAWRNTGRCIMRTVWFSLELRDCRHIMTAEDCFNEMITHLKTATNGGSIKPMISIFHPKSDGKSSPVRIWNPQLIGYAGYKCSDGTIIGDPARLEFTALCVKFGWVPPVNKSAWDILPLLISDEIIGHSNPKVFNIPDDAILEVDLHHPTHNFFSELNLRWYAIPAISNMGIDIGGVVYQTCPFNGWYQCTEISRDLLDKQRYNLSDAVAIACDIPRKTSTCWKDDVQLQVHKAILHSFAAKGVSIVDHHTASDLFMEFHRSEISKRKKCPADWVWIVPPAGSSMTSVFHQEMLNFIVKPQYRALRNYNDEFNLGPYEPALADNPTQSAISYSFKRDNSIYDRILIYYGSETGTSLRYATALAAKIGDECCIGPSPLDNLPHLLNGKHLNNHHLKRFQNSRVLVLVVTSTYGEGSAPSRAQKFKERMEQVTEIIWKHCDFLVFALGNSAYKTFVSFGNDVHSRLQSVGCRPRMKVLAADELLNQDEAFQKFQEMVFHEDTGIMYCSLERKLQRLNEDASSKNSSSSFDKMSPTLSLNFIGATKVNAENTRQHLDENFNQKFRSSWLERNYQFIRSMDSFSFQIEKKDRVHMDVLQPGDHVALYPKNIDSVVKFVKHTALIPSSINDSSKIDQLLDGIDLALPLTEKALRSLQDSSVDKIDTQKVLNLILEQQEGKEYPSIEDLSSMLQPQSLPFWWFDQYAPRIQPRFFSISSIQRKTRIISILQSAVSHSSGKTGTTSRWLRDDICSGDTVLAKFSQSDFHLPDDNKRPILCIGAGSGISPFRSFWMSNAQNPIYLFYGTKSKESMPFSSEINQLSQSGNMKFFVAYSQEPGKEKKYIQHVLMENADIVLPLLYSVRPCKIFVCGFPAMENAVRVSLMKMMADGNDCFEGLGMTKAAETLAMYKHKKMYIPEVYGAATFDIEGLDLVWDAALKKVARISETLKSLRLPIDRVGAASNMKMNSSNSLEDDGDIDLFMGALDTSHHNWKEAISAFDREATDSDDDYATSA